MTDQELKDLVASLAISGKKTDERIDKLAKKIDKQCEESTRNQNNHGDIAEEFFYKSLERKMMLGKIHYDEIGQHWRKPLKGLDGEYDIVMINGSSVAMVEVKYKGHINDLIKLKETMIPRFKTFFPEYKNYNLYAAFASFFITKEMEDFAKENGIYLLERKGEIMETISSNIKAF